MQNDPSESSRRMPLNKSVCFTIKIIFLFSNFPLKNIEDFLEFPRFKKSNLFQEFFFIDGDFLSE